MRTKTFVIGDIHGRRAQLRQLLELLPRDPAVDTLVVLGDLIDRGDDAPGVVADLFELQQQNSAGRVVILRGNHEEMMLDFIDHGTHVWVHPATGGDRTFEQYTGHRLSIICEEDFVRARGEIEHHLPTSHMQFLRGLPLYYEDDYAIYVHAALDHEKHPRDTAAHHLLWARDADFYTKYNGKPCVFGHTPTARLPLRGRFGRRGIYIFHSAIGIDTGYTPASPLSCLQLPELVLYQVFSDGRTTMRSISTRLIPAPFREMRKEISN